MPALYSLLSPSRNWTALTGPVRHVRKRRQLLSALVMRELQDANVRSVMGAFWIVGAPLITTLTYIFAFTVIFRVRVGASDSPANYVSYAMTGLAFWIALQEVASRAPGAILYNANLVKQIVFPTELLPLKIAFASQVTFLVMLTAAIGASAVAGTLTWASLLLTPLVMLAFLILSVGLAFFLSALAVFFPDIRNLVQLFFGVGLFLHPILFPPNAPPITVAWLFKFSPLSHMIWCFRDALYYGRITEPASWAVMFAFVVIIYLFGYRFFQMLKPSFGNAL